MNSHSETKLNSEEAVKFKNFKDKIRIMIDSREKQHAHHKVKVEKIIKNFERTCQNMLHRENINFDIFDTILLHSKLRAHFTQKEEIIDFTKNYFQAIDLYTRKLVAASHAIFYACGKNDLMQGLLQIEDQNRSAKIKAFAHYSNHLSTLVILDMLNATSYEHRMIVMKRWLHILARSMDLNIFDHSICDLLSASAIYGAFVEKSIDRLMEKKINNPSSLEAKFLHEFELFNDFFDRSGGAKKIFSKMFSKDKHGDTAAIIPLLAPIQNRAVRIFENNKLELAKTYEKLIAWHAQGFSEAKISAEMLKYSNQVVVELIQHVYQNEFSMNKLIEEINKNSYQTQIDYDAVHRVMTDSTLSEQDKNGQIRSQVNERNIDFYFIYTLIEQTPISFSLTQPMAISPELSYQQGLEAKKSAVLEKLDGMSTQKYLNLLTNYRAALPRKMAVQALPLEIILRAEWTYVIQKFSKEKLLLLIEDAYEFILNASQMFELIETLFAKMSDERLKIYLQESITNVSLNWLLLIDSNKSELFLQLADYLLINSNKSDYLNLFAHLPNSKMRQKILNLLSLANSPFVQSALLQYSIEIQPSHVDFVISKTTYSAINQIQKFMYKVETASKDVQYEAPNTQKLISSSLIPRTPRIMEELKKISLFYGNGAKTQSFQYSSPEINPNLNFMEPETKKFELIIKESNDDESSPNKTDDSSFVEEKLEKTPPTENKNDQDEVSSDSTSTLDLNDEASSDESTTLSRSPIVEDKIELDFSTSEDSMTYRSLEEKSSSSPTTPIQLQHSMRPKEVAAQNERERSASIKSPRPPLSASQPVCRHIHLDDGNEAQASNMLSAGFIKSLLSFRPRANSFFEKSESEHVNKDELSFNNSRHSVSINNPLADKLTLLKTDKEEVETVLHVIRYPIIRSLSVPGHSENAMLYPALNNQNTTHDHPSEKVEQKNESANIQNESTSPRADIPVHLVASPKLHSHRSRLRIPPFISNRTKKDSVGRDQSAIHSHKANTNIAFRSFTSLFTFSKFKEEERANEQEKDDNKENKVTIKRLLNTT